MASALAITSSTTGFLRSWKSALQGPRKGTSGHGTVTSIRMRRASRLAFGRRRGGIARASSHGGESIASLSPFDPNRLEEKAVGLAGTLSGWLPCAVLATGVVALAQPASFTWVRKDFLAPALGGIMLSIGLQLSVDDFATAAERPRAVLVGYAAQYLCKPLLGLVVAKLFSIPSGFAAGFLLTASVGGAQLSSYAAHLGGGDVALSIILTALSTITSVAATPALTALLIGAAVPVDGPAMARSILQVVIVPVALGLLTGAYAKRIADKLRPAMPIVAAICTSICIGSPLACNRARIVSGEGIGLLLPILAFHAAAFSAGYWICKLLVLERGDERVARAVSLCTGMQSSTLAGVLAGEFLGGGSQEVAPACSVIAMAAMGLSLASFWGRGHRISRVVGGGWWRWSAGTMVETVQGRDEAMHDTT